MMSSTSPTFNLSFLVNHGSALAALIQRAGCKQPRNEAQGTIDHAKIVGDISKFLDASKDAGKGRVSSLAEKGMAKVIQKIQGILGQLIKDDPKSEIHYRDFIEQLAQRIKDLTKPSFSSYIATSSSIESSDQNQTYPTNKYYWQNDQLDFEAALRQLSDKEKRCLSFCFSLFSTVSSVTAVEIKKRDLIQWWIGMDFIDEPLEGDQILGKLLAEEFMLQIVTVRITPSSMYTMHASVLSKLVKVADESLKDYVYEATEMRHHYIAKRNNKVEAAINISAYTLNVETFDLLFLMKNVKVVHLGSWRHDMDYVVVEDIVIRFLKDLKNLKKITFLSLQGISRIEELPESVYSLSKLKVLDLRGCEDLRLLPKGIESLKQLTHLDLSKCYQLVYISKAITSLPKLIVLKGFVIILDSDPRNHPIRSCAFRELSKLKQLRKLSIRTRRMNFPTNQDVKTLGEMQLLSKLRIAWVRSRNGDQPDGDTLTSFPMTLKKLELQAASENTASRLLSLISNRRDSCLEKLYISGGGLEELGANKYCFLHVKVVRLRHLLHLHTNWSDIKHQFPSLARLEIFGCPNLFFFPCNGNGVWDKSESSW